MLYKYNSTKAVLAFHNRKAKFRSRIQSQTGGATRLRLRLGSEMAPRKTNCFPFSLSHKASVVTQRLSYPPETVSSNKITNRIVLSFKDSPKKTLGRRSKVSLLICHPIHDPRAAFILFPIVNFLRFALPVLNWVFPLSYTGMSISLYSMLTS